MEEDRMILAGEIGATRTRLAAFDTEGTRLHRVTEKIYMSQEHAGLPQMIADFVLTEGIPVHTACFGVAGPVRGGRSKISNIDWTVDCKELAGQLKLETVGLINDMEAYAYGIDALESKDFVTLAAGEGEDAEGNRAVISARTGLGVAGLYWDGFRHHPFPSEGGHASFAPRHDVEIELLNYLFKKHGHVSCERVLSGPGLKNIYDFLRDADKAEEPVWLKNDMQQAKDQPAMISHLAMAGKSPLCEMALDLFVGIYGSETGNCALKYMTTGGIFVGGSIAAKILPKIQGPTFMQSFLDKGRMEGLLKAMPVKIVLNDDAGILGAARYTLIQKAFKKAGSV
jgi:glucokinase